MIDPSPDPEAQDELGAGPVHEAPPSTPSWVKISGIILLLLILGFVILKLAGVGDDHGPGRHTSSDDMKGLAVSNEVVSTVHVTAPNTETFGSSRADVVMGQTVSLVAITGNQADHEPASIDSAMQQFSEKDPLDHVAQSLNEMLHA